MQLVVRRTSAVVNIGIAVALSFSPVVALNASDGFLFEFVHMEYKVRHGTFSLFIFSGDNGDSGDNPEMARHCGCHHLIMRW